jgi:hypothetical protein
LRSLAPIETAANGQFERTGANRSERPRTVARTCHAEGRGFESLHPLSVQAVSGVSASESCHSCATNGGLAAASNAAEFRRATSIRRSGSRTRRAGPPSSIAATSSSCLLRVKSVALDGPTLEVLTDRNSELGRHRAILRPSPLDEPLVVVRVDEGRGGDSFQGFALLEHNDTFAALLTRWDIASTGVRSESGMPHETYQVVAARYSQP